MHTGSSFFPDSCETFVVVLLIKCSVLMAGLVKAKKYEWQDSNLALFGSDLERNVRWSYCLTMELATQGFISSFIFFPLPQVKKAAAETEEAWKDAGSKVGLQIWRIVKFKVKIPLF